MGQHSRRRFPSWEGEAWIVSLASATRNGGVKSENIPETHFFGRAKKEAILLRFSLISYFYNSGLVCAVLIVARWVQGAACDSRGQQSSPKGVPRQQPHAKGTQEENKENKRWQ